LPIDRNYAYFQEFISDNDSDIRVVVIGKRAFAIKRMVREGDFRASGSGNIIYSPGEIPLECLRLAFELSARLDFQCAAYDFVFHNCKPLLIEVSYGFNQNGYLDCPGYWDDELNWYEGMFCPEWFMIEDTLRSVK